MKLDDIVLLLGLALKFSLIAFFIENQPKPRRSLFAWAPFRLGRKKRLGSTKGSIGAPTNVEVSRAPIIRYWRFERFRDVNDHAGALKNISGVLQVEQDRGGLA